MKCKKVLFIMVVMIMVAVSSINVFADDPRVYVNPDNGFYIISSNETEKTYNINQSDCAQFEFSRYDPWAITTHRIDARRNNNWFNKTNRDINWTHYNILGNNTEKATVRCNGYIQQGNHKLFYNISYIWNVSDDRFHPDINGHLEIENKIQATTYINETYFHYIFESINIANTTDNDNATWYNKNNEKQSESLITIGNHSKDETNLGCGTQFNCANGTYFEFTDITGVLANGVIDPEGKLTNDTLKIWGGYYPHSKFEVLHHYNQTIEAGQNKHIEMWWDDATKTLTSVSMSAPTSNQIINIGETFTIECTPTCSGAGGNPNVLCTYQYSTVTNCAGVNYSISLDPGTTEILSVLNNPETAVSCGVVSDTITAQNIGTVYISVNATEDIREKSSPECFSVTVKENRAPNVTNPAPPQNKFYNFSSTFEIGVNASDQSNIDTSYANITYPNGSSIIFNLQNDAFNRYNMSFTTPRLLGEYNITFMFNDTYNNRNNTVTTNFTVTELIPPNVTSFIPVVGSSFQGSEIIEISVNVTDNWQVSKVNATINLPTGSKQTIQLYNSTGNPNKFNASYTIPDINGLFIVNFSANDTYKNYNSTESTSFAVSASACGNIATDLTLTKNVESSGSCFNITANNITINCANYNVTWGWGGSGTAVNNTGSTAQGGYDDLTIKNCNFYVNESLADYNTGIISIKSRRTKIYNTTIFINGTTDNYAISFIETNDSLIYNTTINTSYRGDGERPNSFGVNLFNYSSNNTIEKSNINTWGSYTNHGVLIRYNSSNNTIKDSTIIASGYNSDHIAVYIRESSNNNIIRKNTIISNGTGTQNHAIWLRNYVYTTLIENNSLETLDIGSANYGLRIEKSNDNTVRYNSIRTNGVSSNYGIYIFDTSKNNTLLNNTIKPRGSSTLNHGVYIERGSSGNYLIKNIIYPNGTGSIYGVGIVDGSNNTVLLNNTLLAYGSGNSNYGIYLINSISNSTIQNNNIIANGTTGLNRGISIQTSSFNNFIVNNTIYSEAPGSNNYGIYITSNGFNNTISKNYVTTNGSGSNYAIWLTSNTNNTLIENNTLRTSGSSSNNYGIYIQTGSYNSKVSNNYISASGSTSSATGHHGIYLTSGVNNTYITDNSIFTNQPLSQGIYLEDEVSQTYLINNNISSESAFEILDITNNNIINYFVYNNSFGEIKWIDNGSKSYLRNLTTNTTILGIGSNIIILNNTISVNTSSINIGNLNSSVNVTLFGIGIPDIDLVYYSHNYTNSSQFILTKGTQCNGSPCQFQSFTNGNGYFNASSTLSYSLTQSNNVCKTLTSSLTLIDSVSAQTTCFIIGNDNVILDCSGYSITFGTSGTGKGVDNSAGYDNVAVKNCIIIKGSSLGADNIGIETANSINFSINNNTIYTNGTSGSYPIFFNGYTNYSNIVNNTLYTLRGTNSANNYGIYLKNYSHYNNITANIVLTNGSTLNHGIFLEYNVSYNIIENNTIRSNGINTNNHGIYLTKSSINNLIRTNNIYANSTGGHYGIYLDNSYNTIVENNTVETGRQGNGNYGIHLFNDSDNNTVRWNQVQTDGGNSNWGIYLFTNSDDNLVENNTVRTRGTSLANYAVYVRDSSSRNIIHNNVLLPNSSSSDNYGIYITTGSNHTLVENNTIRTKGGSNHNYGIFLDTNVENNTIRWNYIVTNGTASGRGINLNNNARNNLIENNSIRTAILNSANNYGILLFTNSINNTIRNNVINTTGTLNNHGIWLYTGINDTLIENNTIYTYGSSGTNYGIYLLDGSMNNTIRYNNIRANGDAVADTKNYGIWLTSGINGTLISDNNIITTQPLSYGIFLDTETSNNLLVNNNITARDDFEIMDHSNDELINYLVYNNSFGEIKWIDNGSKSYLRNLTTNTTAFGINKNIIIKNNTVGLNSSAFQSSKINSSANITLNSIGLYSVTEIVKWTDFNYTIDSKNITLLGEKCINPYCYNLSYQNGNLVFNTTGFSMFSGNFTGTPTEAPPSDTTPPNVTNITPELNSVYNVSNIIYIGVNVSDSSPIDTVFVNISYPNNTAHVIILRNHTGQNFRFNTSFIVPNQIGLFNLTFFANDSNNNINYTEKTNFTSRVGCGSITTNTTLTHDVYSKTTCFTIETPHTWINCAGHSITGNRASNQYGITTVAGEDTRFSGVENCIVEGWFNGIRSNGHNQTIRNNTIINNNLLGIFLSHNDSIIMNNNLTGISSTVSGLIRVVASVSRNTIINNYFNNASVGIELQPSSTNNYFVNNSFTNINTWDIWDQTDSSTQNLLKYNNTFGEINFKSNGSKSFPENLTINFTSRFSLGNSIYIADNIIAINSSIAQPIFNNSVNMTLRGLTLGTVNSIKMVHNYTTDSAWININGINCSYPYCYITDYTGGILQFNSTFLGSFVANFTPAYQDSTAPSFFNPVENPTDPTTYSKNKNYKLNITVYDLSGVDKVIIYFNGSNTTVTHTNTTTWMFNTSDLGVGVYNYMWFANDTTNTKNQTISYTYTVSQAPGDLIFKLNDTEGNIEYTIPGQVNASATSINSTVFIWRNGTNVTGKNHEFISLPAGHYNYTAIANGSQNFSEVRIERLLIVTEPNTAPSFFNPVENPTDPQIYSSNLVVYLNITVYDTTGINGVAIYINGTNETITHHNGTTWMFNRTLPAGTHTYQWFANDTTNKRNQSEKYTFTINQAPGDLIFKLNDTEGNIEYTLPGQVNASATSINSTVFIWRNGTNVTGKNHEFISLPAGHYNYTAIANSSQNFSEVRIERLLIVTEPTLTCGTITTDTTLTENLVSTGTCFTIGASNIVLNGNGYTITGDGTGSGIRNVGGYTNVIIKNFGDINNYNYGIELNSGSNVGLFNNIIRESQTYGIYLAGTSENNDLYNNNITNSTIYHIFDATATSLLNYLVYNNSWGEIQWTDNGTGSFVRNLTLNTTNNQGIGIDKNLFIANNTASVNSTGFTPGRINSTATIELEQLTFAAIKGIMALTNYEKDRATILTTGKRCDGGVWCTLQSFDGNIAVFDVLHFSSHTLNGSNATRLFQVHDYGLEWVKINWT